MQITSNNEHSVDFNFISCKDTYLSENFSPKNDIVDQMTRYHSTNAKIRETATAEIVYDYTKFISYIINTKYASYKNDWEELIQQGILGILNALLTYDPKISKPTTYFYSYIVHELTDYVSNYKSTVSPYYATQINKIKNAISELEKKGIKYSEHEISVISGYSIEAVNRILELINRTNLLHYESDDYLESCLTRNEKSPESYYINKEQNRIIHNALLCLPAIERKIVVLKTGFVLEKQSYKSIAKKLKIPVEQVKLLYKQALQKLKKHPEIRKEFSNYTKNYDKDLINGIQIQFSSDKSLSSVLDTIEEVCF